MSFNLRLTYKEEINVVCMHCGLRTGYDTVNEVSIEECITDSIIQIAANLGELSYALHHRVGIAADLISALKKDLATAIYSKTDIIKDLYEYGCKYEFKVEEQAYEHFIETMQELLDFSVKYPLAEISRSE